MHVIISEEALDDLGEIWDFVGGSSVAAANELVEELVERALRLDENPHLYAIVWWLEEHGVRRMNVRSWAIFYRILPSHIDVARIVHGGMRMEKLFGG